VISDSKSSCNARQTVPKGQVIFQEKNESDINPKQKGRVRFQFIGQLVQHG
jgi:hypothetical protein